MSRHRQQGKRRFSPTSLRRKAMLRRAGATYKDLAALASVSYRMVQYWMDDEKTSDPIQQAFDRLTAALAKAG